MGFLASLVTLGVLIYWKWAPNNLFFTFVIEGTGKIVVKGGEFSRFLIQWQGHTINQNGEVVEGNEPWHPFGGLRFYGIWPVYDIYVYRLRWTSLRESGEPVQHDVVQDFVLLKDFVYYTELKAAEDKDKVPLTFGLVITLRIVNPYKALFVVQDWLELTLNRIKPLFREFVARHSFEELLREKQAVGGEVWESLDLSGLLSEIERDYGVKVKPGGIEMKDITPPEDYQKAATLQYLADREKEAILVKADAEAGRIQKVFGQIRQLGDLGKLIRTLEALEKSPLAASMSVQFIPGLQDVLRGAFGGRPVEAVPPEDIRRLREAIERLVERLEAKGS